MAKLSNLSLHQELFLKAAISSGALKIEKDGKYSWDAGQINYGPAISKHTDAYYFKLRDIGTIHFDVILAEYETIGLTTAVAYKLRSEGIHKIIENRETTEMGNPVKGILLLKDKISTFEELENEKVSLDKLGKFNYILLFPIKTEKDNEAIEEIEKELDIKVDWMIDDKILSEALKNKYFLKQLLEETWMDKENREIIQEYYDTCVKA